MPKMNDVPPHESFTAIGIGGVTGTALTHIHMLLGIVVLGFTAYAAFLRAMREHRADRAEKARCKACRERSLKDT